MVAKRVCVVVVKVWELWQSSSGAIVGNLLAAAWRDTRVSLKPEGWVYEEGGLRVVEKVQLGSSGSGDCMVEIGGYRRWRNYGNEITGRAARFLGTESKLRTS